MLRWFILIFGGLLLITTLFLHDYRANHAPDSTSIVVAKKTSRGYELIEVDFARHEKTIAIFPDYVEWYELSPDGKWLMLMTTEQYHSKIHMVNRTNFAFQTINKNLSLANYPMWSPYKNEFAYIEEDTAEINLTYMSATGKMLGEYQIEFSDDTNWSSKWVDEITIQIINHQSPLDYIVDLKTGAITSSSFIDIDLFYPSPDERFGVNTGTTKLELLSAEPMSIKWTLETDNLAWISAGWSYDSQWIGLIAQNDYATRQAPSDIYMISITGNELLRLTNDKREKSFLPNAPSFDSPVNPFSYNKNWLVFSGYSQAHQGRTLSAVRTDGSQEEIRDWVTIESFLYGVQWMPPPPDLPIHTRTLIPSGLGLLIISFSLSVWRGRKV